MSDEYKNFLDAMAILAKARDETVKEVGSAFNNPAWGKLWRAGGYLASQIEKELAG